MADHICGSFVTVLTILVAVVVHGEPYRPVRGSWVLDSSGGSAELRSIMGLYEPRNPGEGTFPSIQQPYFEQKNGSWVMLYNSRQSQWQIQLHNDSADIPLRAEARDGSSPPREGWQFLKVVAYSFLNFKKYVNDSTLTIKPADTLTLPECSSVFVSSSGPAKSFYSSYMGEYTHQGEWKDGHPVFVGENGMHLATGRLQGRWYIARYGTFDCETCPSNIIDPGDSYKVASGRATFSPADPSAGGQTKGWVRRVASRQQLDKAGQEVWVYLDPEDGVFKEDKTFKIDCRSF